MKKQLFYIQDSRGSGCVGNCVLWWAKKSKGYTTELENAGLYDREFLSSIRSTDIPYLKEEIDRITTTHVRIESLSQIGGRKTEMNEMEALRIENRRLKEIEENVERAKGFHYGCEYGNEDLDFMMEILEGNHKHD